MNNFPPLSSVKGHLTEYLDSQMQTQIRSKPQGVVRLVGRFALHTIDQDSVRFLGSGHKKVISFEFPSPCVDGLPLNVLGRGLGEVHVSWPGHP